MIACVQPLLPRGGGASASTSPTRRAFAAPPPTYHRRRHCRRLPHTLPCRASAAHGHAGAARFAVGASPLRLRATPHLSRLAGSSRPRAVYPPTHPDSRGPGGIILRCAPRPIPTGRGATSSLLLSNIFFQLIYGVVLWWSTPASAGCEFCDPVRGSRHLANAPARPCSPFRTMPSPRGRRTLRRRALTRCSRPPAALLTQPSPACALT